MASRESHAARGAFVPRGDDLDDFHAVYGGSMVGGCIESQLYPDDVSIYLDEDRDAWRKEIADKMARRKTPGFGRFDGDPPLTLHNSTSLRRVA